MCIKTAIILYCWPYRVHSNLPVSFVFKKYIFVKFSITGKIMLDKHEMSTVHKITYSSEHDSSDI